MDPITLIVIGGFVVMVALSLLAGARWQRKRREAWTAAAPHLGLTLQEANELPEGRPDGGGLIPPEHTGDLLAQVMEAHRLLCR